MGGWDCTGNLLPKADNKIVAKDGCITVSLENLQSLIIFRVGPCYFCAEINQIESIVDVTDIHALPQAPKCMLGGFSFREDVASVIDLYCCFNLGHKPAKSKPSLIVAKLKSGYVACQVDEVLEIINDKNLKWSPVPRLLPKNIFNKILLWDDKIVLHTHIASLASLVNGVQDENFFTWLKQQYPNVNIQDEKQNEIITAHPVKTQAKAKKIKTQIYQN